jgi:hypothetical protein
MTREEHIKKAEELLAGEFVPSSYPGGPGWHKQVTDREAALAQIHATLAVAMPAPEVEPRRRWWSR